MNVWQLVIREVRYRRWTFALAVAAVLVAVGGLVAELTLLGLHDARAEGLAADQEARTRGLVDRLQDDYRRITLGLGYNVLILPREEDVGRFYAQGYASTTMPEAYVRRLADSPLVTVQHLLPSLHTKVEWPERQFPIVLIGTRGEAPLAHRDPKKPLQAPVPKGTMVAGHVLAEKFGLREGGQAALLGRTFTVHKVHPARGNEDDVTVWIDLGEAQELLGQPGRINAILALSCFCAEATPEGIRREITTLLDGQVQVIELAPQAATRRAARARAAEHAEEAVASEQAGREQRRLQRDALAAWIVPLLVVGGTAWVGLLALTNVRQRAAEIGILRALGVRAGQVLVLVLARALAVGVLGAVAGCAAGLAVAAAWDASEAPAGAAGSGAALVRGSVLAAALVAAPLLSVVASLLPAVWASRQDPALVLREE